MLNILLIGIEPDYAIRRGLKPLSDNFNISSSPEEALSLMHNTDLFILDGKFGMEECSAFLDWTAKNTQAIGVIVEDTVNNMLCIKALNCGIVCDYIIRPTSARRYAQTIDLYMDKLFYRRFYYTK